MRELELISYHHIVSLMRMSISSDVVLLFSGITAGLSQVMDNGIHRVTELTVKRLGLIYAPHFPLYMEISLEVSAFLQKLVLSGV